MGRTADPNTASLHERVFSELKTIEVRGQRLRVGIRHGEVLPPLVIFNGIGANLELLEPFVSALEGVEVIAFDVPGIGGSPAPILPYRYPGMVRLVDHMLRELGYYDAHVDVLGVSWGGGLAQQFAYLLPGRCRRLVLAATCPGVIMVRAQPWVLRKLLHPRRYFDPEYLKRIAPDLYGGVLRRRPDLIEQHSRHIAPPHGLGYTYQMLAMWDWTSLLWLHRLQQQTLIMAGTDDPIVPLANASLLAHFIPRSRVITIDDGHLFLITSAHEVAPIVRRFLRA